MDPLQLLILKNQYEILSRLEPENRDFAHALTAIDQGYELEIQTLIDEAVTEPVSSDVCREVRSILDMYRNLQNSLRKARASEDLPKEALFPGFDGNCETSHYCYACFLLEDKGLWQGLTPREPGTWNSHYSTLDQYRSMLSAFHSKPSFPYPTEFVEAVLSAGR